MATLQQAIAAIQAKALALEGMREAPDYAPEQLNVFPFAVTYAGSGRWEQMAGWKRGLHTVVTEIHIARKDLPRDISTAMPYCETFPNSLLADPTLGGVIDAINDVSYVFGPLDWGQTKTIGFRFSITLKQQSSIT